VPVKSPLRRWLAPAAFALALGLGLSGALACNGPDTGKGPAGSQSKKKRGAPVLGGFSDADAEALGKATMATLKGEAGPNMPEIMRETEGIAFVALRSRGEELAVAWGPEALLNESFSVALAEAREAVGNDRLAEVDLVEIDLAHDFHEIEDPTIKNIRHHCSNRHRGVRGLELAHGDDLVRYAPTQAIQDNRKYRDEVKRWWKKRGIEEQEFADAGSARWFNAEQLLVDPATGEGTRIFRGNVFVDPSEVTKENVQRLSDMGADWLIRHIHEDGRITYVWYPKDSVESDPARDNNMIRQWMATNALEKIAEDRKDDALYEKIEKNIDYNLAQFYRVEEESGLGYIQFKGRSKLGAISLATMAIVNHPKREKWAVQESAMLRTIDSLHREDGSFDTMFKPPRSGVPNLHNFYPGETLLLWAALYEKERDPAVLEKIMRSFEYYSKWHMEHRKPSFIPWHTQAYYSVWSITKDQRLADFVFEMNDWLVEVMQQWTDDDVIYRDEKGRFFSRKHEKDKFGPPHASSTGVYLEGLIDAYKMARELGDEARQERYRRSMARGLRSVMQLQFVDDVDMYYVTNRERTRGGIRTAVYRNEIRVDNVQHNLMGIIKILHEVEDYSTD
jgi:hypothetical protein